MLTKTGKKTTILATVCIMMVIVVFFEFYVFRLPNQQTTTVSIIKSDPSAWVNKTVAVDGNLDGPLPWEPDASIPYDYTLNSGGQTIGLTFSPSVNLTSLPNSSITVRIHGIIKEGFDYMFSTPIRVDYYIEAENVERV